MTWHVSVGSQQYVAGSVDELSRWLREGRIGWDVYVYHPNLGRWIRARDVPEIRAAWKQQASSSPKTALVIVGCIVGVATLFVLFAAIGSLSRHSESEVTPGTSNRGDRVATTPNQGSREVSPPQNAADYEAGYARGKSEGVAHARSGAGMPIPLGMNWMADVHAQSAHPNDAAAWKDRFKKGFEAGFKSVSAFDRNEADWEQLSWQNARSGVRLYDYGGKHEATIRSVDRNAGLIVVRYKSGEVEPKNLEAVSLYWWVRKK
jgi:GYF domain 2